MPPPVTVRFVFVLTVTVTSMIRLQDYDTKDLVDFEETILKGCDFNKDGKISRKELTMILLALSKQSSED